MPRDSEEPVITQTMIAVFVLLGAEVIPVAVILGAVGPIPMVVGLGVAGAIIAAFGIWIAIRWRRLNADDEDESEDPVTILKRRYAAGEISEEAFERKLDRLIDAENDDGHDSSVGSVGRETSETNERKESARR